jgi:uncharacterized protein
METVKEHTGEKIDMFCHILPPKYKEVLFKKGRSSYYMDADLGRPALFDMDVRFKVMDNIEGLRQVLTLGLPPLDHAFPSKEVAGLARMANEETAELVAGYPERFIAGVASLPLNDLDASLRETERAIEELHFKGVQIYSSVNGKPLDRPEFLPLYEKMAQYDLPLWIHPVKDRVTPDYADEAASKYALFLAFGWPYETTLAMSRLVFSGIMEKYPNLKFITHHCGGMLPFFYKRVALVPPGVKTGEVMELARPPLDYFKRFYADTVLGGNVPALMAGHAFFGTDHMLFASDYPYPGGADKGEIVLREVIRSVEMMGVSEEDKAKIFSKNARRILSLS